VEPRKLRTQLPEITERIQYFQQLHRPAAAAAVVGVEVMATARQVEAVAEPVDSALLAVLVV
jgi:hypothetical protein